MICIKCGHANPDSGNFCEKCNAKLLKMATGQTSASMMDVEEGQEYLTPQKSYVTQHLYDLAMRAHEYIYQEGPGEPLLEAFGVVKEKLDDFEFNGLPSALANLQNERMEWPDDQYPPQVMYLLNKGVSLYREGVGIMDRFVENGENDTLIEAITKMQEGNDNLGLALEVGQAREQMIDEEIKRREQQARTGGGASGTAEARLGGGEPAVAKADSGGEDSNVG